MATMARRWASVAAFAALSMMTSAQEVTPVSKVIDLLVGLKSDVEAEGQSEATTYDTFACFCKEGTKTKSDAITSGRDNIDSLSADIQEKTALKEEQEAELKKRGEDHEAWTAELSDTEVRFEKATAEYEAQAADLSKAISSLEAAIKAMEDSKPTPTLLQTVQSSLALARAMDIITEEKRKTVSAALLQVDPADPSYAFHSQGIIETLKKLLTEFRVEKSTLDAEWAKAKDTFQSTIQGLKDKIQSNQDAMDTLTTSISDLTGQIATSRGELVSAEALLKDDQLFLKDLTERCEARAKDWDQRSQMRADELEALTQALAVMKDTVKERDSAAVKRALLVEKKASLAPVSRHASAAAPSLLQEVSVATSADSLSNTASALRGARVSASVAALQRIRSEHVAALLGKEGKRLSSVSLAAIAGRVADGPFDKVKGLIQQLIERLLAEATAEATKKGFCDESLGKARKDRDFRHADAKKLDVEIKGLNLKKDELEEEIELLTGEIEQLREDLKTATEQRAEEKVINLETIKKSGEGFEAVKQAIDILKVFYARAGRAKVVLTQYSPIDEDSRSDAGFEGAYKGKQERSKGIIGMLQVIASDFDRAERHTEEAEAKAHAEFVEFDRSSRADIEGKETKKTLDEEDLKTTNNKIASSMEDLQSAQNLLDSALRKVEDLKPMCIDTGMSYEDRVAKREEEVAALKKALCILDTNQVEAECQV